MIIEFLLSILLNYVYTLYILQTTNCTANSTVEDLIMYNVHVNWSET